MQNLYGSINCQFSEPGGRNGGIRLDQEHRGDANFLPWQCQSIPPQNGHCQEKSYGNHQWICRMSQGPLSEQVQTRRTRL